MNKIWLITEKITGILVTAWGVISLYSIMHTVWEMFTTGFASAGNISYAGIIYTNHLNFLLSLAALYGGVALLFNGKDGWILSIITSTMFGLSLFISSRIYAADATLQYASNFKSYGLLAIVFIVILVILLQKPFRIKYRPTAKQWLWMAAVTGILLIDKLVF